MANVKFHNMSLTNYIIRAIEKAKIDIKSTNAQTLCDLRPTLSNYLLQLY